ncbi:hypothetical protein [Nocardioides cynanchi]|uniref:hypothetical protein n=1 Tax=Nocardioides cynanchi TaxID=2558918 RepID=UPI0012478EA9|nr:hypothetical protein [Nocardioides cynanchi]
MNEIDDVLERIEVPAPDVRADVERGERALRRRHGVQVAGAAVAVAAIVSAVAAFQGSTADHAQPGFAGPVGGASGPAAGPHRAAAPRTLSGWDTHHRVTAADRLRRLQRRLDSRSTQELLVGYRNVLAEHLDPGGNRLRYAENQQGGTGVIGTKLDWNGGGMLEIVLGHDWAAAGSFYDLDTAGMTPTTYRGQPARVSSTGDDLVVSVRHDDGTVVTLIASTGFGNNGTSTAELGLTQDQLLAAAADPRLMMPSGS